MLAYRTKPNPDEGRMVSNPNYQSYLLRLWRDGADHPWRASLQCAATGEKLAFANLLMLFAFLVDQVVAEEDTGELAGLATWLQTQIATNTIPD